MSTDDEFPEIIFMPGCFDEFSGTQEELDELIEELRRLAKSGELLEASVEIDFEMEDSDEEYIFEPDPPKRTLN